MGFHPYITFYELYTHRERPLNRFAGHLCFPREKLPRLPLFRRRSLPKSTQTLFFNFNNRGASIISNRGTFATVFNYIKAPLYHTGRKTPGGSPLYISRPVLKSAANTYFPRFLPSTENSGEFPPVLTFFGSILLFGPFWDTSNNRDGGARDAPKRLFFSPPESFSHGVSFDRPLSSPTGALSRPLFDISPCLTATCGASFYGRGS